MDIASAVKALASLEAALTITQPSAVRIKAAYPYPPDRNVALPDTPCWINAWSLTDAEPYMGPGAYVEQRFVVHSQLFVLDSNISKGAEIASAFLAPLVAAWDADVTLAGTVSIATLRGGDPTLATLEWAGKGYQGLNLFWDLLLLN